MKKIIDASIYNKNISIELADLHIFCQAHTNWAGVLSRSTVSAYRGKESLALLTKLARKKLLAIDNKTDEVFSVHALLTISLNRETYQSKTVHDCLAVASRSLQSQIFNNIKDLLSKENKEIILKEIKSRRSLHEDRKLKIQKRKAEEQSKQIASADNVVNLNEQSPVQNNNIGPNQARWNELRAGGYLNG